jgi:hypothetical protein
VLEEILIWGCPRALLSSFALSALAASASSFSGAAEMDIRTYYPPFRKPLCTLNKHYDILLKILLYVIELIKRDARTAAKIIHRSICNQQKGLNALLANWSFWYTIEMIYRQLPDIDFRSSETKNKNHNREWKGTEFELKRYL